MSGYVKAYRARFIHPMFEGGPWCRGYAWDWMVSQAAWREHQVEIKGRIIQVNRGQFTASVRFMADKFGWSKSTVVRFLTRLKTETMIGTEDGTGQLVVTICNYNKYQDQSEVAGTEDGTASGTGAGQERDKVEEGKEVKEKTEEAAAAKGATPIQKQEGLTNRERLLVAMGADPVSGIIGPNGKYLGGARDMAIAAKWAEVLTIEEQCQIIAERAPKMRTPPGSFAYFDFCIADLVAAKTKPLPEGRANSKQTPEEIRLARWHKLGRKTG